MTSHSERGPAQLSQRLRSPARADVAVSRRSVLLWIVVLGSVRTVTGVSPTGLSFFLLGESRSVPPLPTETPQSPSCSVTCSGSQAGAEGSDIWGVIDL